MDPAESFIEQIKRGRTLTDRTALLEPRAAKHDQFGDVLPFVQFEERSGNVIGWVAVHAVRAAVEIAWIEAARNGSRIGQGEQILANLCGLADKLGAVLTLQAGPWDEAKLDDLISWYERWGFVLDAPPRSRSRQQRLTRRPLPIAR